MPKSNRRNTLDETDAKAGSNEGVVRWVLAISLGLTVIAFAVLFLIGSLSQDPIEGQQNVERKVEAAREKRGENDSSIDGVVADDPDAGAPKTSADR